MATSKKISELTTATAFSGSELFPVVQDGETRQTEVSVLRLLAPVQSVNGLTGIVMLALGDLTGVEPLVSAQGVSAAIGAVSIRVDDVSALVSTNIADISALQIQIDAVSVLTSVNSEAVASVSVRVDNVSAAITSVQTYVLAQISVATSDAFTEAPIDGQIYGRQSQAWVPVSVTAISEAITSINAYVSTLDLVTFVTISTSTFEISLTNQSQWLRVMGGTGCSITFPTSASVGFPVRSTLYFEQVVSGNMTFSGVGGLPLNVAPTHTTATNVRYAVVQFIKVDSDTWTGFGNLTLM